jgi:hypothetical protein
MKKILLLLLTTCVFSYPLKLKIYNRPIVEEVAFDSNDKHIEDNITFFHTVEVEHNNKGQFINDPSKYVFLDLEDGGTFKLNYYKLHLSFYNSMPKPGRPSHLSPFTDRKLICTYEFKVEKATMDPGITLKLNATELIKSFYNHSSYMHINSGEVCAKISFIK